MSNSQTPSPTSKLRALRHGLGEILGFVVAALAAVLEILAGRWPEVKERRRRKRAASKASADDQVTSYPAQEG